jgi:hypothetical protein
MKADTYYLKDRAAKLAKMTDDELEDIILSNLHLLDLKKMALAELIKRIVTRHSK